MLPSYSTTYKREGQFVCETDQNSFEVYPIVVQYRALSLKEMRNSSHIIGNDHQTILYFLEKAVTAVYNVPVGDGTFVESTNIFDIPAQYRRVIVDEILKLSRFPGEDYEKLRKSLDVSLDKQFKGENWTCEHCQKRKLDKTRNCPIIGGNNPDSKFYNKGFVVEVNNNIYNECPIYSVDPSILSEAQTCYDYYKNGHLPEAGGVMDQTEFFSAASSLTASKVNEYERRELQKQKDKMKNKKGR